MARALQSIWLSLLVTVLVSLARPCLAGDRPQVTPPKGMIPFYNDIELKDGRILLLGCDGCDPHGAANESSIVGEVYDPKTRTFSKVGRMIARRCGAQVVVLPTQEVLFVAGGPCNGWDRGSFEKVVEIFNPGSGSFRKVGELHTRRAQPSATMLHNGQVLIAEGLDANHHLLREAEIYDPQEHRLQLVGDMVFPRCEATRVVLADGSVLFAGGYKCNWPPDSMDKPYEVLKTAERYDPNTARFDRVGDMTGPRNMAAAILLREGRALVVGGRARSISARGNGDYGARSDAEIYDPRTSAFTSAGKMAVTRDVPVVRLMNNGEVLVTGGSIQGPPGGEVYDPATNSFRPMTLRGDGETAIDSKPQS